VEGFCEHGNEPSGSIKCCEILEQLSNWRLLEKGSAPWSLVTYVDEFNKTCILYFSILDVTTR
jgi:hypothetical protein